MQDNGELFDDKMKRLTGQIAEQFAKSKELEEMICSNLSGLGYDFEMSFRAKREISTHESELSLTVNHKSTND
ncbi:MAG: hypothetical protein IT331_13960 [Anaerolineae bacterium]|nr:hypothetical protein [Anaerolineae bacterium]